FGHVVPRWNFCVALGELGLGRNDAERFLACESFFAKPIPALLETAAIFIGPLFRHVVRRVRGAGRKINKKWLIGSERLLLLEPRDRFIGEVRHQMIALFRSAPRLHRRRILIERWVPLVRLARDEAVKMLKSTSGRPIIERSSRARMPRGNFV